ncbi:glycosyltransferase family 32 protein [Sphingomonas sp. SORGH_AS_0879]|uniref:glycosyltransferase family 32 protein n=1 Tax=Sphingomonas sp. SORGH_AS_0879 TaxID=3041790 RepID=UPI00277DCF1F|nr:glycosyltransferase [Sphingomonas sp. SORGH_AS_0879]MDQ1231921.1 hypothetical protein [Sphingomonas sp. SORGH_AS_0879]
MNSTPAARIPRLIHQTYRTKDLSDDLLANVEHLKTQNPSFSHHLYDDADIADFIRDEYGAKVQASYDRIRPEYGAARADLFRYLLMYARGGVYLDIKSTTTRPLEETLRPDDSFVTSHWANRPGERYENWGNDTVRFPEMPEGELQQWHIIAEPKHPFLEAVINRTLANIDHYSPWRLGIGAPGTLQTTGPICYTRAILPLFGQHPHRRVRTNDEIGLQYSIYERLQQHQALSKNYYRFQTKPIVDATDSLGKVSQATYQAQWLVQRKFRHLGRILGLRK